MKMIVLMENTPGAQEKILAEHGLSVYLETERHRLLVDTGAGSKTIANAELLGVDLKAVDTVVISHGHYDHAGGLLAFCARNPKAAIYMQRSALEPYYHDERYIGVDPAIGALPQCRFLEPTDELITLDEELSLFSNITGRRLWPQGNKLLSRMADGALVPDRFDHEQCLCVCSGGKRVLLSGCAHNGILNILDRYWELCGTYPDAVISGFHMSRKSDYTPEERENILQTAKELKKLPTVFYTGHCTGLPAMALLQSVMGDQLRPIHSGDILEV